MSDKQWLGTNDPVRNDIRVTFLLKGEEAVEFRRALRKRNGTAGLLGKRLVIRGMVEEGLLPKWWLSRGLK